MYYKPVNPRSNLAININYYPNNEFGIDLVKTQISTIDSPLIIIVSTDKKIIHSQIVNLLNKMYKM
jgi:hypothetical protein